jgi:hypothetical protein
METLVVAVIGVVSASATPALALLMS